MVQEGDGRVMASKNNRSVLFLYFWMYGSWHNGSRTLAIHFRIELSLNFQRVNGLCIIGEQRKGCHSCQQICITSTKSGSVKTKKSPFVSTCDLPPLPTPMVKQNYSHFHKISAVSGRDDVCIKTIASIYPEGNRVRSEKSGISVHCAIHGCLTRRLSYHD